MSRRTIVVTGASDGIGADAARRLATRGEQVVVVGRSRVKTIAVANELGAPHHLADFADLAQVRALAAELDATYPRLDVLVNNAGGIMGDRTTTVDGFEKTFQVNHLAGFLLTHLLLPTLIASNAKVIQTASAAAKLWGVFDIDDLQNTQGYTPQKAYGNGKLANILFTRELHRRYHDRGVAAVAFHPGVVATNFASDTTHLMRFAYHTPIVNRLFTITPERSAGRLLWLVDGVPGRDWEAGGYYEKNQPAASSAAARDDGLARQLWERSAQLLHLEA